MQEANPFIYSWLIAIEEAKVFAKVTANLGTFLSFELSAVWRHIRARISIIFSVRDQIDTVMEFVISVSSLCSSFESDILVTLTLW